MHGITQRENKEDHCKSGIRKIFLLAREGRVKKIHGITPRENKEDLCKNVIRRSFYLHVKGG
jgi:hypothetical protein